MEEEEIDPIAELNKLSGVEIDPIDELNQLSKKKDQTSLNTTGDDSLNGSQGFGTKTSDELANLLTQNQQPQTPVAAPPQEDFGMEQRTLAPKSVEAERQKEQQFNNQKAQERITYLKTLDNGQTKTSNALNAAGKAFANASAGLPQTISILANKLDDISPEWLVDEESKAKNPEDYLTGKFATYIKETAEDLFPTNPALQDDFFSNVVPSAAGQMGQMFTGGLMTKAANKGLATMAKKSIAKPRLSEPAFYAMNGAAQQGASQYDEALQTSLANGDTEEVAREKAFDTFKYNLLLGGADAIPVTRFLNRVDKATGGTIKDILPLMIKQGAENFTTEFLQKVGENSIAKLNYDDSRELVDGALTEGAAAGLIGMVLTGASVGIKAKLSDPNISKEQESEEYKKLGYLSEKMTDIDNEIFDSPLPEETNTGQEQQQLPQEETIAQQPVLEEGGSPTGDTVSAIQEIQLPGSTPQGGEQVATNENIPAQQEEAVLSENAQEIPEIPKENLNFTEALVDKPDQTEDVEIKEKKRITRLLKHPDIADELKENLTNKNYIVKKDKISLKEAETIIDIKGIDQAHAEVFNTSNDYHPKTRAILGDMLIDKYNTAIKEATDPQAKEFLANKSAEMADFTSELYSKAGQALQAGSVFFKQHPVAVVKSMQKSVKKSGEQRIKDNEGEIQDIKKSIRKVNKEVSGEISKSDKVKSILDKIENKKAKSPKKPAAPKEVLSKEKITQLKEARRESVGKAIDFLESLKIDTKGKAMDVTHALPVAVYNGSISAVQEGLKAGLSVVEAVESAIKYIKDNHKEDWDEEGFKSKILGNDSVKEIESVSSIESGNVQKALRSGLKEMGVKLDDIVKKHYTEVDATKKSLTDKLASDLGLDSSEAKELADVIHKEFDKLASDKKKQLLKKTLSVKEKVLKPKKEKEQLHEEIIRLSNLGALSEAEFTQLYADKMGIQQELTPEQLTKLVELAEKAQEAPDGFQKTKAAQDLLKYQESLKGIDWRDVGMGIWYANMLSGLSTQMLNISANFNETLGEVYIAALENPKEFPWLMKGLFQGYGGKLWDALDTLKSGYDPVKGSRIDIPNILERVEFKGGAWNPYNYLKYVRRVMTAADIVFYGGLKEMRSHALALKMAEVAKLEEPTVSIKNKAIEILNNSSEKIAQAKEQAKREGLKGLDYKRRVFELIEQSRPESINEDANDFASRGTFNYDPEGALGALTAKINNASRDINIHGFKPLQFIVPFTRIIANVANRYLDWSPWGLVRVAKGGIGYSTLNKNFHKKYTPQERLDIFIKAMTGSAAMVTLMALSDEEEGLIEITANGTGNFRKNYELAANGWQQYSVRVGDKWYNYQNTPLAIPMSIVGMINDSRKYKGDKDIQTKIELVVFGTFKYMTDLTFLQGLSDFLSAFSKDGGEEAFQKKLAKTFTRVGKSLTVPNIVTQTSRAAQEIMDMPMKEARSMHADMVRDLPVLRDNLNNMYNSLGEPVVADQLSKFIPFKVKAAKNDKVWKLIADNQAWVGMPGRNTLVYDEVQDIQRELTEKEYSMYAKLAGEKTKAAINDNYENLIEMESKEEVQKAIKKLVKASRQEAKYELFVD